jgi:hypothetical protein
MLVLNRGYHNDYNVVGWVDRYWLTNIHYEPPYCSNSGWINVGLTGSTMVTYQCPGTNCNKSSTWYSQQTLTAFCQIGGWPLMWNQAYGEVGFSNLPLPNNNYGAPPC